MTENEANATAADDPPSAESAAEGRDTETGRFLPGNQVARRTGVRAFQERGDNALPPDLRDELSGSSVRIFKHAACSRNVGGSAPRTTPSCSPLIAGIDSPSGSGWNANRSLSIRWTPYARPWRRQIRT